MRTRSVLVVAATVALTLTPVARVGAQEDPGAGLSSYSLRANAPGLGLDGLYKDVALTVPETTSSLTTGGVGAGLAALAWPGPVIGNAGTTILVLQPAAPPQVTALNDPVRAESRSGGPQSATYTDLPGTVMASTATGDKVTASSRTGSGTTLPVGTLGAFSGSTSAVLTGAATATTTAESAVEDLVLADGAIRIGSVRSTATATSDGVKGKGSGETVVTGMSVGGVPVTVDGKGLHVAGQDAANPVPQQALNDAVAALGLTVVLTSPRVVQSGAAASYDAGALVLMWAGPRGTYALTLGRASAAVAADTSGDTGTDDGTAGPDPGTGAGTGTTAPPPAGSTSGLAAGGPLPDAGGPSLPTSGPPPTVEPPATSTGVLPAAVSLALAGGVPAGLAVPVLLLVGLVGLALMRLPGLLLHVPATTTCEELT